MGKEDKIPTKRMDQSKMEGKVKEFCEWLKAQPQFPQNIDKNILKMFIRCKEGDMNEAKSLLEYNLKFREKYGHVFLKRDPLDKSTQQQLEIESFLQLPGKSNDNYKVFINRLNDTDPTKYNFLEVMKAFFLMSDLFILWDNEHDYDGELVVFDMTGMSWRHQLKVSLSIIRIFIKAVQEAYPLRLKQIHIINATIFIDTLMKWTKPFWNTELYNMLQIHLPNSDAPYEHFSRDILPDEYGGKAGKIADLREYWMEQLMEKRDYLINEDNWKLKSASEF